MTIKIRTSMPNSLAKAKWQAVMLDTYNLALKSLTALLSQRPWIAPARPDPKSSGQHSKPLMT